MLLSLLSIFIAILWIVVGTSKVKLHPFLVLFSAALLLAFLLGLSPTETLRLIQKGLGNIIQNIVSLLAKVSIILRLIMLHPVEVSLLRGHHFEQVDSIFTLLDFLEFAFIGKDVEALNGIFSIGITPLELFHSTGVLNNSHEALPSVWSDHSSIVVHFPSLKLHQRLRSHIRKGSFHTAHTLHLLK